MTEDRYQNGGVLGLVVALVVVLIGGVLFVGATSGWFDDPKIILDNEYKCSDEVCSKSFVDITVGEYEDLIKTKKTFVVFVNQDGCATAERLKGYALDYVLDKGITMLEMTFSDVKESSLYKSVKYYPSIVIVSKGKVVAWLKADSDDDAKVYNEYAEFQKWMNQYLQL